MDFKEKQAIYIQIAEYVGDQILLDKYPEGEKLISIREMAVQLEVNPNTVQRTYDLLQQQGVIRTQRGIGYFVADEARAKILTLRKAQFMSTEVPAFFRKMKLLGIELPDVCAQYDLFEQSSPV
jgi:GntR family transcriptional regulator